ncbi:TPA: hypothetical protein MO340_004259 [Salmonella enterica subsp. salamae serovar 35:g,m,s,t:-]|nr:hypothetical protein [Salmonella enterica subsp. salamae serovar 35:g,m,s,t:-]HCA3549729.1 hypothetical protein [Salmonella enterica subsp. salamae serovar 35:g,m,s,t:-]
MNIKLVKNKFSNGFRSTCQYIYCGMQAKRNSFLEKECMRSPLSRKLFAISFGITTLGLTFSSPSYAEGGWAGVFSTGADQADSIKSSLSKIFMVLGIIFAGYGGVKWKEKNSPGGESVKAKHVFGPIIAGVVVAAIGYFMKVTGETLGVSESDYGNMPG